MNSFKNWLQDHPGLIRLVLLLFVGLNLFPPIGCFPYPYYWSSHTSSWPSCFCWERFLFTRVSPAECPLEGV
jgi:hypothetical protein